jgi:exopolysaccharide production protein ExoZ
MQLKPPMFSLDEATPPPSPAKFGSLELARGIAALLVVLDHAGYLVAEDRYFGRQAFGGLLLNCHVGVDFFFVLSGFIIAAVHWADGGEPTQLKRYAIRRFLRIFPPYWIILTFVVIVYSLEPSLGLERQHRWPNVVASYVLFPMPDQPVLGVAWTLVFEMAFYIFFAGYILLGRSLLWLFVPWTVLILVAAGVGPVEYPFDFLTSPYHLEFAAGVLVAALFRSRPPAQRLPMVLLAAAGGSVFSLATLSMSATSVLETPLVGRLVFGLASAAIILGCTRLEAIGAIRVSTQLQTLGAMSYSLYLTHVVTESLFIRFAMKIPEAVRTPETVAILISLAGGLGGWAFWQLVERPLQGRLRRRRSTRFDKISQSASN